MAKPSFLSHLLIIKFAPKRPWTACGLDWMKISKHNNARCSPKTPYVRCKNCQKTDIFAATKKVEGRS